MQHQFDDSTTEISKAIRPRRKRVSTILEERLAEEPVAGEYQGKLDGKVKKALNREPRRRTIYIPDDTTVMTIHPGGSLFDKRGWRKPLSPRTGLDLVTLSEEEEPLKSAMRKEKKTAPRKSLAVAPKRAPLQQSIRAPQNVTFAEDVVGIGGGKENVPPGKVAGYQMKAKRKSICHEGPTRSNIHRRMPVSAASTEEGLKLLDESRSQRHLEVEQRVDSDRLFHTATRSPKVRKLSTTIATKSQQLVPPVRPQSTSSVTIGTEPPRKQKDMNVPVIISTAKQKILQFPVITEDLANPELYEEQWLDFQEVALTQLLNGIFEPADQPFQDSKECTSLRKNMLAIYSDSSFPLLNKRLQASLMYGALSIPKEIVGHTLKLKEDVGLRRKFISLWIDTYDLTALRAAVEVITGRELPMITATSRPSASPENLRIQNRSDRRAFVHFFDLMFIQHEDANRIKSGIGTIAAIAKGDRHDDFGSYSWCWRRTVLKSMMIILLLDKAKAQGLITNCLFQPSSEYKSSVAVLQALGNLLLPSLGDISRPLAHLNYTLEINQLPLQEYRYRISNIAVDLRDGILLAHLVEILHHLEPNEGSKKCQSLTSFLKYPCSSRAQKLYNVQITLTSLWQMGVAWSWLDSNITAEDIVDGHREKTLTLLWSLVSQLGLPTLVDWDELRRDIIRRSQHIPEKQQRTLIGNEFPQLLLLWVKTITASSGIMVTNFTTSFADNRVLEAIADAYLPFFPKNFDRLSINSSAASPLQSKLRRIGCSKSFASLFARDVSHIPTANETLITLTFLASRLLPLSRLHRAATCIQHQWRTYLNRRLIHKRLMLLRFAHHCSVVVQTRERVVGAAVVLQRAWRRVLDLRIEALLKDVITLQALSRGWLARRKSKGKLVSCMRGRW
jgi:abnormal spindle-like microcephaly-associated protein